MFLDVLLLTCSIGTRVCDKDIDTNFPILKKTFWYQYNIDELYQSLVY